MVKQNQRKSGFKVVPQSEGVCAGHTPHLSEPQVNLQGKWLSLHPFFFRLSHFDFPFLISGKCYTLLIMRQAHTSKNSSGLQR